MTEKMVWRVNEESLIFEKMERRKIKEEKKGRKKEERTGSKCASVHNSGKPHCPATGTLHTRCSPGDTEGLVCTL